MTSNLNKKSALGAMIMLFTACAISISAQTDASRSSLIVKPDSIRETKEATVKRKPVPPTADTGLPTGADEVSEVKPSSEVLDSTLAAGERAESRAATRNTAANPQAADSDEWQFQITPYFWLASLHGTAGIGNRTTQVDESFSDIFGVLKFALMGVFEARKDKLVILTDLEYVSVEDDKATPGPLFSNLNAKFKTFIFSPEVGYRVFADPDNGASLDVTGGIRVWHVNTDLAFGAGILPAINVQGSRTWVDAVGGLRGRAPLSEKIFLTGKFDLGGGGSKFTYQVFGGGGYSITNKVALIFGYRVLDVNYNKNNFIYDMNQRGPIMGIGFKF